MYATNIATSIEHPPLDPEAIAEAMRKARVLRAEAFLQLCVVGPARRLRAGIDAARRAARAPLALGA